MHYRDLPVEWQRKVRQYSILVVRLTEFNPQEPAELFYRLNQPSSLTSAEQRNAYIGATRDQIKALANKFLSLGASKELIGFSNSRLAYDEVISKFCYTIEIGTLKKKITSNDLSEKYYGSAEIYVNGKQIDCSDETTESRYETGAFSVTAELNTDIRILLYADTEDKKGAGIS